MGCCGSAIDKDTAERLETVEKQIKAVGLKTDDASLEEVAGYAKELQSLFEIFAAAADMRMLEQVQELSDVILRNLLARIDPTFLDKGPDSYQATLDRIMAVATDLDAVRATKATKMVQGHVDRLQETMHLAQEKAVDPIIKRIQAIREKLQQPGQGKNLIAGTKDILVSAEQGLKAAPGVKQVAKGLLEQLVAHSIWVLEAEAAWSNPEACDQVVELSQQVDDLAERLVKPLSATWDPPITPQAERVRQRKASEACDMLVAKASKHLEADEGGDAYHCLVELLPWWPSLKSSRSLEIVGLFSKMQSYAHEAFLTAAKGGDTSAAEEIRGFAMQFDELRGKFTGLPEASGSRPLGEALEAGEAKIQVAKSLDIVDAEVAKTTDDDESTNLSLGTTIEALEALKVAWPLGGQDDGELEERLQRSCRGLEDFTFEAINTSPVEQLTSLMQFAQEYDVRHSILVPGSDALRPKLATKAALKCLQRAEGELEKTEGMKPHVLLDSLKALIAINPDASDADIRTHLLRVMASTNERLLKSFSEAISAEAENEKKELLLHKFAESADEVRTALSVPGDSLVAAMQTKRGEVAEELIDSIQDQINGQQLSLSKEINALSRILKKLPEDSAVRSNAVAVAGKFVEALSSAPVTEVEKLLESSQDGHLGQALKDLQCDMPDLRAKMLSRVVHAHLETARSSGSELADLEKELEILEKLRKDEAVSADIYVEISKFADSMEEPFLKKMLQEGRKGGSKVLELTEILDRLRGDSAPMLPRLRQAHQVVGLLEVAQAEVQKVSGMNPKVVCKALIDLEPLLSNVSNIQGYADTLQDIVERFKDKLEYACQKAFEAEGDVDAKLEGLGKLAESGDAAQDAFAKIDGLSFQKIGFFEAISKVVAQKSLEQIEEELSKESGMNPKLLLQYFQELGRRGSIPNSLKDRRSACCEKVGQRMKDSMEDAKNTSNVGKQKALLQFAKEFDVAVPNSSLEAQLQAQLGSDVA